MWYIPFLVFIELKVREILKRGIQECDHCLWFGFVVMFAFDDDRWNECITVYQLTYCNFTEKFKFKNSKHHYAIHHVRKEPRHLLCFAVFVENC